MSRNAVKASPKTVKKTDRRVRRTRDALGDALVALMHEKPFAEITVQHLLDRAGVSRSTFYTHYRDKDDLFLSDVEDFLELMAFHLSRQGDRSNRMAPVRELFTHVAEWQEFHGVLVKAGKIRDFLELARDTSPAASSSGWLSWRTGVSHVLPGGNASPPLVARKCSRVP